MLRILLGLLMAATLSYGAQAQQKPFEVMMILFRGATQAEQGFMDQLKARIPV